MPHPDERTSLITDDGLTLFTHRWTPEGRERATVVLVHGYGEHAGRYNHVARALTQEGATVVAYDQRGYGRSEGRRAYVDDFDVYLDDLDRVLGHVRRRMPEGTPLFLYGHSMGGLVVLRHVLWRTPEVDGLILSAPAVEVDPNLAPVLRKAARWLGKHFPRLPTVRSPEGAISRDPAVLEDAENDPLNYHGRVLARTGAELLRAGNEVRDRLDSLTAPTLLLHGTADRLVPPSSSRLVHDRAASPDITLHLYDGLYHETHNEPEQDEVLGDVRDWLRERIG